MASINQGDDAVERLDNAVTAFEQIMTGPEGQTVAVPGHQPQPTLAERVKQNLKPSTDAAAGYAAQAREEATKAAREADRASQIAGLDTVAEAVGLAAIPFPDVWIPLSDSLRMLAGYGREVKVGDDVVANYATLTRNSAATMVNKSLSLAPVAINEARFERDGLLVEPRSTNILRSSDCVAGAERKDWFVNNTNSVGITQIKNDKAGNMVMLSALSEVNSSRYLLVKPSITTPSSIGDSVTVSFWVYIPVGSKISRVRVGCVNLSPSTTSHPVSEGQLVRLTHTGVAKLDNDVGNIYAWPFFGESSSFECEVGEKLIAVGSAQVEALSYPTSDIPTDGAAVTRAADKLTIPRLNNDCAEWYSGPDQINPIVTADTIELVPPAGKLHLRNVRGFFTPLTPAQKAALK